MPYSIVMLLRSPFAMTEIVLQTAASRAFKVPYDGSQEMYYVGYSPLLTLIKAGPWLIKVMEVSEGYLGDPHEVSKGFDDKRLQDAWSEHRTWVAFDLMNDDIPKRQAYKVLATLVSELLESRCAGIYLPQENQFTIESDGSAALHLRSLRS